MHKIKLFLLFTLLIAQSLSLSISNVALKDPSITSSLYGSVMGGTKLYIEGVDFSLQMG